MATQNINVRVSQSGAVSVARALGQIGDSARTTTTYLNGMRAILAAALTFSGAGQITETIDTFIQLQNRLKIVATETNTVSDAWGRLLTIANNSYSTIDSTVNLYYRVSQAFQQWGESAKDAYEFTDLFQKSAILSGSTMQTTSQAVYQFSQALNKGKLDGDEFRSVLEGLPYVAALIQKSLGVTRAELYELSKDGKISVDRLKQAFEDAAATINGDFAKITPTIGMALTILTNNWVDFVGRIQTSTGVFSGLAYLIIGIANNFDLLAIALTPVGAALAFLAGRLALGLVVTGLKDLAIALRIATPLMWLFNAAMAANPFVLGAIAIAAIVAAIIWFRNELGLTNEVLLSLWEMAKGAFGYILIVLSPIAALVNGIVTYFWSWGDAWKWIQSIAKSTFTAVIAGFNSIIKAAKDFGTYIMKVFAPLFQEIAALGKLIYEVFMQIVDLFVVLLTPAAEELSKVWQIAWKAIKNLLADAWRIGKDIYDGWVLMSEYVKNKFFPVVRDVFEGWIIILGKVLGFVNKIIAALKYALTLLTKVAGAATGGGGGGGANYGAQFKAGEGFNNGGGFKVGGTGAGRDTTPVAFRANRGERVTVETKKQQRVNDNAANQNAVAPSVNVPLQVINVLDPRMVLEANQTQSGQRTIVNVIKSNRDEIIAVLGG